MGGVSCSGMNGPGNEAAVFVVDFHVQHGNGWVSDAIHVTQSGASSTQHSILSTDQAAHIQTLHVEPDNENRTWPVRLGTNNPPLFVYSRLRTLLVTDDSCATLFVVGGKPDLAPEALFNVHLVFVTCKKPYHDAADLFRIVVRSLCRDAIVLSPTSGAHVDRMQQSSTEQPRLFSMESVPLYSAAGNVQRFGGLRGVPVTIMAEATPAREASRFFPAVRAPDPVAPPPPVAVPALPSFNRREWRKQENATRPESEAMEVPGFPIHPTEYDALMKMHEKNADTRYPQPDVGLAMGVDMRVLRLIKCSVNNHDVTVFITMDTHAYTMAVLYASSVPHTPLEIVTALIPPLTSPMPLARPATAPYPRRYPSSSSASHFGGLGGTGGSFAVPQDRSLIPQFLREGKGSGTQRKRPWLF